MTIPSQGRADTAACTSPSLLLLARKVLLFSLLAKDGGGEDGETQTHIVALPQKFRKREAQKAARREKQDQRKTLVFINSPGHRIILFEKLTFSKIEAMMRTSPLSKTSKLSEKNKPPLFFPRRVLFPVAAVCISTH